MKRIVLAALFILAACAGVPQEAPTVIKTVNVPVPIHCNPTLPPQPMYPDDPKLLLPSVPHPDAAARLAKNHADAQALMDVLENQYYEIKWLLSGRLLRAQREKELMAALDGCK